MKTQDQRGSAFHWLEFFDRNPDAPRDLQTDSLEIISACEEELQHWPGDAFCPTI